MLEADFLKSVGFEIVPVGDDAMLRIRSTYKPGPSEQPASLLPVNAAVLIPAELFHEVDASVDHMRVYAPWLVLEVERQSGVRFTPRQAQAVWRFAVEAILCELDNRTEVGHLSATTSH